MRTSVINHPENEALIIIRRWQSVFCDGNEVAAALMSFFEYWHNIKIDMATQNTKVNEVARQHGETATADTSLYQWHTETELIAGIEHIAKTGKTLSKGIDFLVDKGVISVHKNPNPRYKFDKTRHFLFHPDIVNEWLLTKYRPSKNTSSSSKNTSRSSKKTPASSKKTPAIPETTTETTTDSLKASSADADYSLPVSLLTIDEIKVLKLYATDWQQYLDDEKAERQRKGVIDFIEKKLAKRLLLPDTPASQLLFQKIAIENDAKGRRSPETFPTLAIKEKFDKAAVRLNGTLEKAIQTGIENVGIAIPKLVNYVSSPKWQEGENNGRQGKGSTQSGQPKTYGNQSSTQQTSFAPPAGAGQSAETAARLQESFAPKP